MGQASYYRSEQIEIIRLADRPVCYPEHNHVSVYTIGFILKGRAILRCGGQAEIYPANRYFIIKPFQLHSLELAQDYCLLSICVHKELIQKWNMAKLYDLLAGMVLPIMPEFNTTQLKRALKELFLDEQLPPSNSRIMESALAVWDSPENERRIQVMAKETYFSQYHFIKLFKQNIGITPHQFQLQNRVRKAQRLIEDNMALAEVATTLGFYDQSHFAKCFKKILRLTPAEYKRVCLVIQ